MSTRRKRTVSLNSQLGIGLYTPAEAAYYAEVTARSAYRWLYNTARTKAVVHPEMGQRKIVTFLDFVQLYIINAARGKGISLQSIRKAIKRAEREGQHYPLARKDVFVVFSGELHTGQTERDVEQFTGKYPGQMLLHEITQPFVDRIRFDAKGFADSFQVFQAYDRRIAMDPEIEFGLPLVGSTGFPSYILANAAKAEGSARRAADAYAVKEDDVRAAVAYHDQLDRAA